MVTRFNFFLLILVICSFAFFTCSDPFLSTTLVPHTGEPAYDEYIESDAIELILFGDSGTGDEHQSSVASWMKTYKANNPIDFAIMVGDNFYNSGVLSVDDINFNFKFESIYNDNLSDTIFYPVLGNHDTRGNINAQILYTERSTHWKMPFLYYNFVYSLNDNTKIEFFALDSNIIVEESPLATDQTNWFKQALSVSDADWKIVYAHHPLFSNGDHGNNQKMIDEIKPLLEEYSVDIFVGGHDHDLQVIKPLNGVHYLVSGAAAKLRPTNFAENSLYAKSSYGFMTLKIHNNSIVLRVIIEDSAIDYEMIIEKN